MRGRQGRGDRGGDERYRRAFRLVGGSALRGGHVLERLYRDARAGYLHSFTTNQLYDFCGRYELGLVG